MAGNPKIFTEERRRTARIFGPKLDEIILKEKIAQKKFHD
jgi:hypothetical protein